MKDVIWIGSISRGLGLNYISDLFFSERHTTLRFISWALLQKRSNLCFILHSFIFERDALYFYTFSKVQRFNERSIRRSFIIVRVALQQIGASLRKPCSTILCISLFQIKVWTNKSQFFMHPWQSLRSSVTHKAWNKVVKFY